MPFEFKKNREVIYPVVIELLPENGKGKPLKNTIHVRFKLLTRPEYTAWTTADWAFFNKEKTDDIPLDETESMMAVIERLNKSAKEESQQIRLHELIKRTLNWDENDVIDQDKNPVPFTVEFLADIFEQSAVYANSFEGALLAASRDAPVKN